jgi:dolichol-phosphate mannosyltransferase
MLLSIVIPTYNERENLPELFRRIHEALSKQGMKYEIIIVDDNSPDGTADLAEELSNNYRVKVVRRPGKLGLSSAVLDGVKVAEGDVVAVMDADLQHPPELLPKMLQALINGCDIVVASRYVEGGSVEGWTFIRKLISKGAIMIARILIPKVRNVKDPVSGFFMFKKEVIEGRHDLNPKGFKILLEVLVKGKYDKVCEIPYRFGLRHKGRSKLGSGEILNYLVHVITLSPRVIKFAIVGALGTGVNLGVVALFRYLLFLPHEISAAAGIEVSVINNFYFNDKWTFRDLRKGHWLLRLGKFHISSLAGILTQYVVSVLSYHFVISESVTAQLIGILLGFAVNYLISKKFVWGS